MIGEYCISVSRGMAYKEAQNKCFRLQSMPSSRPFPGLFKVDYRPKAGKRRHHLSRYEHGDYAVVRKYLLTDKPEYVDKNYELLTNNTI
jgi:hypothetical protein